MRRWRSPGRSPGATDWTPHPLMAGKLYWVRRSGKVGRRLAGFGVLLEPADDPAPRVVDGGKVGRRHRLGPACVVENHLVSAVLPRLDVPGHRRALPFRKAILGRPAHPLAGLELVDPHLQHRSVKAESRRRAYLRFGVAVDGPEAREPLRSRQRLVDLFRVRLDLYGMHERPSHSEIPPKD